MEDLRFCKRTGGRMQGRKCRMNCRKNFLQFMNNAEIKLYKTVEFAARMRIIKTVKRNESLRKCSVGFKTEERVMLSILAVCGAAYLAGMVAMTMHGMKN